MQTTIIIDDRLFERAQEVTGLQEGAAVVNEALRALIEREASRRLARVGGTQPEARLASEEAQAPK